MSDPATPPTPASSHDPADATETPCPPDNDVAEFAIGRLDQARVRDVETHLDTCAVCRALVAEVAASHASDSGEKGRSPIERPLPRLDAGTKVGRYVVDGWLGQGGMGAVYRAHDAILLREVALKVIGAPAEGEQGVRRWMREARAVAALEHPNIVSVFDVGEANGAAFLAMELVVGQTLRREAARGDVPRKTAMAWLVAVAKALVAAHARGIVHRDVKPENVMVRTDGVVKVLDFGLARWIDAAAAGQRGESITQEGALVGTPAYMAPEQLRGEAIDGRADQFAWGVVAYELLARRRPWDAKAGATAYELAAEILTRDPMPLRSVVPELDPRFEVAIMRAIRKSKDERFASMADLVIALDTEAEAPDASPLDDRDAKTVISRRKPNRMLPAMKTIGAAILGAAAIVAAVQGGRALVRMRHDAAEDARVGREIAEGDARLDALVRRMQRSPLHDARQDRAEIEQVMRRLKADVARMPSGNVAGAYAIGRAYLAMHEPAAACTWLERAAAGGPRDAKIELAWGEGLGALYGEAVRNSQAPLGDATLTEFAKAFRAPALAHFRAAREMGLETEDARARVALHEERYADAIRAAKTAISRDPNDDRAYEILGDAELGDASALRASGAVDDAERAIARAGAAYENAIANRPSDGPLYEKDALRYMDQMAIDHAHGRPSDDAVARARARLAQSQTVSPESASAKRLLARLSSLSP